MVLPPTTPPDLGTSAVVLRMQEFKKDLIARDNATMNRLAFQWLQVEQSLEASTQALALQMMEAEVKTTADIYRLQRYQTLLVQMKEEMEEYSLYVADYIADGQKQMATLGLQHANEALQLTFLEGGEGAMQFFDKLPISAIENMIGIAGDGGPVYDLLQKAYPETVDHMTNILIRNVALGLGPGETAKAMMDGITGGLDHALVVARTEQLRVYRESSRMQYEASGAVSGYKRFASKQANTCALCIALDGEVYKTNELMNVHPQDRCTMIPIVHGVDPPEWESGEDWLRKQDLEVQEQILGKGITKLWNDGDIELMDLVQKVDHPIWGPSLQQNTLGSLKPVIPPLGPSDPYDINLFLGASEEFADSLTSKQFAIFGEYKLGEFADSANAHLRWGKGAGWADEERIIEDIKVMKGVLSQNSAPGNLTVYRGAIADHLEDGMNILDQGFCSTSIYSSIANDFMKDIPAVPGGQFRTLFEISVPKGTPGAFIEHVLETGMDEGEFLLQAGTKFRIQKVVMESAPTMWGEELAFQKVFMEVIP